jgi:acyl transferase domain-containing protein/NAD(P)H-dependent flavin oxidoreductase YrpB (nitropropane dioxygenase family)/NAD(P)-dependent dehydrogenase (short-subunit alcohol dehydrogenase family)/acyl carrier protein
MAVEPEVCFEVVAQTSASCLDPSIAISAIQAGYCGILDLEYADRDDERTVAILRRFAKSCTGPLGLKLRGGGTIEAIPTAILAPILAPILDRLSTLILIPTDTPTLRQTIGFFRERGPQGLRILLEIVSPDEAELARVAGCDGIVAKGHEAGGRVGESTSFILLQRLRGVTDLPVWVQGGIGLHTIAAAYVAGAVGVVLDQQLLLTRESCLPDALKKAIARMDGSETQCLGDEWGAGYRLFAGPASAAFGRINETVRRLHGEGGGGREWLDSLRGAVTPLDPENSLWLFGQDAAFASELARSFRTVPGIMAALQRSLASHIADAREAASLAAGSALAQSHGTEFPIVQGPMTRVSDRAEFALRVAEGGALPFLALALMRGGDIEALLEKTRSLMDGRPWGVGILGFVPAELQAEQLAVVHAFRPDFALLAGGRPEQAVTLEAAGIPTYLHVPSPGLMRLFLEAGAKRFIFEGRECGGHVGPRTSFTLWNQMVEVLLKNLDRAAAADIHILFAGGIHDALSSAMVAAIAGPLSRLGCKVGVLVGTAYTMTHEAVEGGAVVETFQQEVANCGRTVLLETGPGHAIRCVETGFVAAFAAEKRRLLASGESHDQMRDTLEALNVGRLRIATKGVDRAPGGRSLVELDVETQRAQGLYMIGQVALLRDRITSIREVHQDIADAGIALLAAVKLPAVGQGIAVLPGKPAEVAIIGMGCILPKAPDVQSFWENILDQVDAIREVPADRWDWRLYYDPDKTARDKIYSKWGGFIDDVVIDPLRYGIPPSSLKSIEPLQLLTLEAVRAALIDAGFPDGHIADPELRRRTSVILGVGGGAGALGQRYAVRASLPSLIEGMPGEVFDALPEWTEDSFPGVLMNVVAGRVANRFDLGGVNFTVDAACGSSLAAVRLAVQELEAGTSDMVIVGGCDAFQNPFDFVAFSKTQALSPRGKCRTFDATADGIAIGEGVALVVLRRTGEAMRDGSRIYARIQGVGGSSDGRDKSLTAPRPEGQALALRRAYRMANFSPATVGLIEAHGTGTVAGDRAEVATLKTVFAAAGAEVQACAIGSVKSMIGHTKCASGTAGLIKAALALYHRVLPPTNNVETPNPEANFAESPFFVAGEARPWIAAPQGHARRAGVSAFGFGGTNFHVALEEHDDGAIDPDRKVLRQRWPSELFLIGGATREELVRQVERLAAEAAAVAPGRRELRELAQGCALAFRAGTKFRLGLVAASHKELAQRIEVWRRADGPAAGEDWGVRVVDPRGVYFAASVADAPRVGFLFPGQGAQYPNMLRDLAMHFEEAREAFAAADASLEGRLKRRLSSFIFPPPAFAEEERSAQQAAVTQTNVAQPAIGAASVAMARLLATLGVRGEAAAGHSYGEYVALHYAGAFDEATLYALSEARGRTMVEVTGDDPGTMASVAADAATIERHLDGASGAARNAQVANRNAPDQTVIAGPRRAVEEASSLLAEAGLSVKPIRVACGFHSRCVAPARDRFADILRQAPIQAPKLPVYANMTAAPYPAEAAEVVDLLADHLVSQVNFQGEILAMYEAGIRVFVEVGPSAILTGLVGRILKGRPHVAVATDMSSRPGLLQLQHALAQLAVAGVPIALERLFANRLGDVAEARAQRAREAAAVTAWMVNGGMARPVRESSKPARRPVVLKPAVSEAVPAAPVRAVAERAPVPPVAALHPRTAANGDASQVMLRYQKLMEGFVAAQQQIMLTYLKGGEAKGVAVASDVATPAVMQSSAPPPAKPPRPEPRLPVAVSDGAAYTNGHAPNGAAKSNGHVPVPVPETVPAPALDAKGVADALIAMISERTGYPPEMLGLDLNIEADLGIDSIKRVEILGEFRKQYIGASTDQVRVAMEQITRKKTLREVVDGCTALLAEQSEPVTNGASNGAVPVPAVEKVQAMALDAKGVADALIAMISERTGYPPEMLDLDLNIEADLGIDSIKRVEILGEFRKQYIGASTDHVRVAMEQITRKKTLREVVEGCCALLAEPAGRAANGASTSRFDDTKAPRFIRMAVQSEVNSRPLRPGKGDVFLITDDEGGVATALAARLRAANARGILLRMGPEASLGQDSYSLDLADMAAVKALAGRLDERIAGVFHCLPLGDCGDFNMIDLTAWRLDIGAKVKSLFNLAAAFGERLDSHKAACVVAATRLGDRFGHQPVQAGIAGLLKSFDKEWTQTRSKSVDFDADAAVATIVESLLIEAGRAREDVEVNYRGGVRHVLRTAQALLSTKGRPVLEIGEKSVVLVTGGARGITAEVACAFAERHRPVMVLCGSSALPPAAEDAATAGLSDPRPVKAALIARARDSGAAVAPAAIEAAYRQLLKDREIRATMAVLREAAASVEYHQVDVRDEAAFGGFIDRIYATHGRIDGVIHGAGIVEDKLIRDKTGDSFDRVVDTKTASAFVLSRKLRPAGLRFLALFTSVAGTFGNRGQSDYGAANEILSKLALLLDRKWPGRVVALSWGPWDKAGMVTPEIKQQFEAIGIEAVSIELGRWAFDAEIRFGSKGEAEPIWGGGPWAKSAAEPVESSGSASKRAVKPRSSSVESQEYH